jgi:diguanylate cyclase (GGDEF)-like protein/PAS domain S-box-containing protein
MSTLHKMFGIVLNNKKEFETESLKLALQRIRIVCIGILFFSMYFFYADFVLFKNTSDLFRITLILCHSLAFILSAIYIAVNKTIKVNSTNLSLLKFIYRGFVIVLLLMGSLPTIITQKFTGNIDAYIVVIFIAAVGFPFELIFMIVSMILNHIIFLVGIYLLSLNQITLVSKQVNSTAMLVTAILFCYSLYKSRVVEFSNKHRLIESEYIFEKLSDINPLPLFITRRKDGQVIMFNDKSCSFYGYSREEFRKIKADELFVNKDERTRMLNTLDNLSKLNCHIIEQRCSSGITKWVIANHELIHYSGETYILTSITDITELKKLETELYVNSTVDPLTGIYNRRIGIELLENNLNITKQQGSPLSVCFIDLNNLKKVNDKYGHSEGDILIRTVCGVIKNSIRETDTFFRYGGDEFVILFPGKDEQTAEAIWSRIQSKFDQMNSEGIKPYYISASHGLFEIDNDIYYSAEEILNLADNKMYIEKNSKK